MTSRSSTNPMARKKPTKSDWIQDATKHFRILNKTRREQKILTQPIADRYGAFLWTTKYCDETRKTGNPRSRCSQIWIFSGTQYSFFAIYFLLASSLHSVVVIEMPDNEQHSYHCPFNSPYTPKFSLQFFHIHSGKVCNLSSSYITQIASLLSWD